MSCVRMTRWRNIAGCVFFVCLSSSSGPSKHTLLSGKPRSESARSKNSRASWLASERSLPIPTYWEPWPGKIVAVIGNRSGLVRIIERPFHQDRSPGVPRPETGKHQRVAAFQFPAIPPLRKTERNRGCRGVAVLVDVDHHFGGVESHALAACIHNAQVRLVRNEVIDVVAGEFVPFQI